MKFSNYPIEKAAGKILAHSQRTHAGRLTKGRLLTVDDIQQLQEAGISEVVAATLETKIDVAENTAAEIVAAAVCGEHLEAHRPVHGRVNLYSRTAGLLHYDAVSLTEFNRLSPAITLAALLPLAVVQQKRLVATIKIIPFAAPLSAVNAAVQRFAQLLKVRPFKRLKIALIQTELPVANKHLLDKTAAVTVQRLANMENTLCGEWRCAHQQEAVTDTLNIVRREISPDLYLIAGASAVCDQADVVPASITAAGGIVTRFGMPTDPGNLLVLATFHGASCIVLPGCARSPKLNGFDWVLARLLAGIETTANDIAAMGVGGLLEDIVDRPVRRTLATKPIIGGILLAAGLSTRMGKTNKLLAPWHEKPLVSHAAHTLIAAHEAGLIQTVVAVCGHEVDTVQAAIGNLLVTHNPDFSQGMASSLRCGLQALTATKNVDGVLVVLGDMPAVTIDDIAAVIAAFDGNNIVVPTHNSKRGNPVLIGRQHFAALEQLQGDTGARALFADSVITEAPASAGVLFDIDSPSALETDK